METESINPRIYVDHTSAIQASATINEAKAYFQQADTAFAAILNKNKVLGLASRDTVLASQTNTRHARDCISAHAVVFSIQDPIESFIQRALKRPENHLLDDIILVDESSHFLGLISQRSFNKIQRSYHDKHVDLLESALDSKKRKIDDLENDLKLAERQLSENREMVRRIKGMRSDFICKFSHEARTPITSIQSMLDSLAKSGLHAEQQQLIDSANASAHILLRLISSTLDYTQIEIDSLQLAETAFSPLQAIGKCLEEAKEEAIEKDLTLQLDHEGISETVLGDERRFSLIVENLIDRALDQTSTGGIRITVNQHAMRGKIILRLEIHYSGMGVSLVEAQDLFEPQNNTATDTHISDIGALVSERIASKMGGRVRYRHEEDHGSLITLDLPFKIPSTKPETKTLPEPEKRQDSQIQVLIVDDNRINVEVAKRFLMKLNCKTHTALSGMKALKILKAQQIDCVFMDCHMPELSGFETTELIRTGECGKHNENIFISSMTAHTSEKARSDCTASGMNHFLAKPVNRSAFEEALAAWRDHQNKDVVIPFPDSAAG